jgi:hypothetical protein
MDSKVRNLQRQWVKSGDTDSRKAYTQSLKRSGVDTLEITDGWPEEVLSDYWPQQTYKGIDAIELLFELDACWSPLAATFEEIDYMQECYMGYVPSKDFFVIGWDCDEQREEGWVSVGRASVVNFSNIKGIHEVKNGVLIKTYTLLGGFYGGHHLYKIIQKDYPDLVGLRYD